MASNIEQDDLDEESGGLGGKKVGIIIALVVLLLGGGAGAAYFFGFFGASENGGETPVAEEIAAPEVPAKTTYYAMPEFLINLSSTTSQTSFIKMKITLRLPSEADQQIVIERMPEMQNEFNTYLRDLRASDLAGSAGMYRLQEELLVRANRIVAPEGRVERILFTEILIQ